MATVRFTLNGVPRTVEIDERDTELDVLRHQCGLTSTKSGCQPQGQCGACLALVDGKPLVTCATPASRMDGHDIVTLEGLDPAERELLARSFVAAAGLQCGFCTPGLALRAKSLVDHHPDPTREEIARGLDVHLCRCTGYAKVVDAVLLYAEARRTGVMPEIGEQGRVGEPLARYRGRDLVLGERAFVDDLKVDGLLHGAVTLSPHARARVVAIDTSQARALPGVIAVATAADVPGERWNGLLYDDWPAFVAVGEEVRCVGDVLAAVAAEDIHTARAAANLVEVVYEVLPPLVDPHEARQSGATRVNPVHDNVLSATRFARGDVEAALATSAHVVTGTWQTQRIEHLFLEPESALAVPRDGGVHLYTQGQGIFDDQRQVARLLGLPAQEVHVELVPNGGAFGGKEDMSVQAQTALLCWLTRRPVRITLTREQSIRMHPKRHPITLTYTVGCDAEGHLTAVRASLVGDTGAYASVGSKVLERAAGHACGPYRVPAVDIDAVAVMTNNPPCGAMRGFGANQSSFAIEGCMDLLAAKVGLDGWEMRWRNAVDVGDRFGTGQILEKSVGVRKTLLAVKDDYYEALGAGRAVGIACGIKNTGIGNGAAEWGKCRLVVEPGGTVGLYNGFTEMGQGLLTVLTQFAVEVTGLPPSVFRPRVDSTFALACGQTTGSRATLFGGRATIEAAKGLRADLDAGRTLSDLVGRVYAGDVLIDDTTPPDAGVPDPKTHTAFGYATQVCVLDERGALDRFIAAHDVGRVVNPALVSGQIEGAVHMGLGFALTEELPCEDGMPVTFKLREIGPLRAHDMPRVEVLLVEEPEPEGPFGAKGVGEIGLVPTAGAVAGALAMFDGTRHHHLPMKDSPAAHAIRVGHIHSHGDPGRWH
ncbi:MAG: selenium-dependent xanthine dehydrogenase [Alphaproteobacteria bacterium]|nr:selenium-dependent xanthine dehydrogenase [Alphaproteobacteria bacterium]